MIIIEMTYYLLAYALLLYCTFDLLRDSNSTYIGSNEIMIYLLCYNFVSY